MTPDRIQQLAKIAAQAGNEAGHLPDCDDCLLFLQENTWFVNAASASKATDDAILEKLAQFEFDADDSLHAEFAAAWAAETARLAA
jgi:hypothetical protein